MSASTERALRPWRRAPATGGRDALRRAGRPQPLALAWRIFAANGLILVAATLVLAISPATVSSPVAPAELAVLAVGLVAILLVNLVLVRRSLAPLDRLVRLMRRVDLLQPGQRLAITGPAEVQELGAVFNEMLARLERERHESGWDALTRQEAERKRVARELHDEVGQALTAAMLQIGRLAKSGPPELAEELNEALETTRASLEDVRRIAKQLRPEALDDLGLGPAVSSLVSYLAARTGLRIRARVAEALPALSDEAELVIYRVAQESLTNVARHAGPTRVDVVLEPSADGIVLTVRDWGRGLAGARAGSGIRGMRERALLIGADFSINPISNARGGGTEVTLRIPVEAVT